MAHYLRLETKVQVGAQGVLAKLKRGQSTDEGTFGVLTFGNKQVFTTELPWRNNLQQKSCIPVGTYQCAIVNSPRFGKVYGVKNVPGRSHVLIHAANFGGNSDLGYTTQLHGCIAPAMRLGQLMTNVKMQRAGLVSKPALNLLMAWADGQPFTLKIT
jgi:hypothetical protein